MESNSTQQQSPLFEVGKLYRCVRPWARMVGRSVGMVLEIVFHRHGYTTIQVLDVCGCIQTWTVYCEDWEECSE